MADIKVSETSLAIIGRSLAYIALKAADLDGKTIGEKAKFLESLGLDRKDVADMLGTTSASITELLRKARGKKPGKKGNGR